MGEPVSVYYGEVKHYPYENDLVDFPNNFVLSGQISHDDGDRLSAGFEGYYWTSTGQHGTGSHIDFFRHMRLYPYRLTPKSSALTVRCIAGSE